MTNITIRNIPDEIMDKIRTLSKIEKRSINNEILMILEKGLSQEVIDQINERILGKDTQLAIWEKLSGQWRDKRSTKKIISDIISKRTKGREFEL